MARSINFYNLYPFNKSLAEEMERLFGEPLDTDGYNNSDPFNREVKEPVQSFGWNERSTLQTQPNPIPEWQIRRIITGDHEGHGVSGNQICARNEGSKIATPHALRSSSFSSSTQTFTMVEQTMEWCGFCKKNQEQIKFVCSHNLRDSKGNVTCPILRAYICPLCGATGDAAHTIHYCPKNQTKNVPPTILILKSARTAAGSRSYRPF